MGLAGASLVGALVSLWDEPDVVPACERASLKPRVVGRTSVLYAADGELLASSRCTQIIRRG